MTHEPILLSECEPLSDEWFTLREGRLGGSEIAPVLGLSPWESRFSLWHRKAGNIGPIEDTPSMEWGRRLEDAVATKFADGHPDIMLSAGHSWTHPEHPWMLANPDRRIHHPDQPTGVLECKTAGDAFGWGPTGTDEVPIYYRCQAVWYGAVMAVEQVHLAVLISGSDYREYVIAVEPAEVDQLITAGAEFMDELRAGTVPDIDAHSETYQAIRELHPDIDPIEVELDPSLACSYIVARHGLADAEDAHQLARSLVAEVMGTARKATWCGQTIATRQARDGGHPYVVAGKKLPDPTALDAFPEEDA